ncbi:uncharacterized protein LOC143026491 isoform X2 [Oratosquilla oratoria]|uniref:uncharacterized protein LOC143026491 isoform X2 n=1 Tax=Oratosquilla oratoria TaxID=337810 RepID=UPI003F764231
MAFHPMYLFAVSLVVVLAPGETSSLAHPCSLLNTTYNQVVLSQEPHLQDIFNRYAHDSGKQVITPEYLKVFLRRFHLLEEEDEKRKKEDVMLSDQEHGAKDKEKEEEEELVPHEGELRRSQGRTRRPGIGHDDGRKGHDHEHGDHDHGHDHDHDHHDHDHHDHEVDDHHHLEHEEEEPSLLKEAPKRSEDRGSEDPNEPRRLSGKRGKLLSAGKTDNVTDDVIERRKREEATPVKRQASVGGELSITCGSLESLLEGTGLTPTDSITANSFLSLCPSIINHLDRCIMPQPPATTTTTTTTMTTTTIVIPTPPDVTVAGHPDVHVPRYGHDHDHDHVHHTYNVHGHEHDLASGHEITRDIWIGAPLSLVFIGLIGLACVIVIPALKRSRYYDQVNQFLLALAVGTLSGDALIHLLPHAISKGMPGTDPHLLHALYGFTALGGIMLFLFMERLHNLFGHGHSHSHPMGHLQDDGDEDPSGMSGTGMVSGGTGAGGSGGIGSSVASGVEHLDKIVLDPHNCFERCPPSTQASTSDANGNNSNTEASGHSSDRTAGTPEMEKLMAAKASKKELILQSDGKGLEMGRKSMRPSLLRQNSSSFNMVLQEYHVGHHGHSHHGHSHVSGRKESLRTMILLGDAMHTFMDGMAIGAAYGTSLTAGVATAIAVLCHELPHKVGDFALLFEMGMSRKQGLKMLALLWLLSLVGLLVGVAVGTIHSASPWIYSFTAGVFLYLALVDLLSELSIKNGAKQSALCQMALQAAGILTGSGIMLVIGIYEHDLQEILEGSL